MHIRPDGAGKIKLSIVHPIDPFGSKVSGITTFLKGFIKYMPGKMDVEFIGVTSGSNKTDCGKWLSTKLEGRVVNFYPLLIEKDENRRTAIPLSLRFAIAMRLSGLKFSRRIIFFNRMEPALLLRKTNTPKIIVIHNDIPRQMLGRGSETLWSKIPTLYFALEKMTFSALDHIYAVSENSVRFYCKRYPVWKEKFAFLPTWVDIQMFKPSDAPKESIRNRMSSRYNCLDPKIKWVLFVGRLQEQKAPIRLLDTFLEYEKKNGGSCLIIVGEGNLKEEMERYIDKMGLVNKAHLIGAISRTELIDFYQVSDALLITSNFEGMPMSVLEALACGLPVVSNDVGEVRRIVKDGYSGEIAKISSPEEIAGSLTKVLKSSDKYTKENCVNSVAEYVPQKILKPVYKMMEDLYIKRYT